VFELPRSIFERRHFYRSELRDSVMALRSTAPHCTFAYSALASFRMGMLESGSASFQNLSGKRFCRRVRLNRGRWSQKLTRKLHPQSALTQR